MSFNVRDNLELVHFVAQDPLYDRERDEFDDMDEQVEALADATDQEWTEP